MNEFEKTECNILLRLELQNIVHTFSDLQLEFFRNFEARLKEIDDVFMINWCKSEEKCLNLLFTCETKNRITVNQTQQLLRSLENMKVYYSAPDEFSGILAVCTVDNRDICLNVIFLSTNVEQQ